MHSVTITGLSRIAKPKANAGGSIILAWFNVEANGFVLIDCALVRTPKNGITVWPPKLEGPDSFRRSISFADCSLRHAVMEKARETYRAMGGTDAEWIPRGPGGSIVRVPVVRRDPQDSGADGLGRFLSA